MLKFNNNHIFTGYLKQVLATVNIPTCKIYNKNTTTNDELIESFDSISSSRPGLRVNYLKDGELYHYFWHNPTAGCTKPICSWQRTSTVHFDPTKAIPGLTKTLTSCGSYYDTATHTHLGEYLRFLRDFYNVNLMSMYNCFTNDICSNINFIDTEHSINFSAQDPNYKIYALPVKLFSNYTIAIDCCKNVEVFCGLYHTKLDVSDQAMNLIRHTYKRFTGLKFSQPKLYDGLSTKNWGGAGLVNPNTETDANRWYVTEHEKDLKLFIKIPASCKSSVVILEGDYCRANGFKYMPEYHILEQNRPNDAQRDRWVCYRNHAVLNFNTKSNVNHDCSMNGCDADINSETFKPVSRLQLLALNTGESYPFATRLIEYLCGSAITPLDTIPDNIKRAQHVMNNNDYYFTIAGIWEPKMQRIVYDYVYNSGPVTVQDGKLVDHHSGHNPKNHGYHTKQGHISKSGLYDVLGYIDKDAEKLYASWGTDAKKKVKIKESIQTADIYDGLYDV